MSGSGSVSSYNMNNMGDVHSCHRWRPFGLLNCVRSLALMALFMSSLVLTTSVTDAQEVSGIQSWENFLASPRLARVANAMIQEDDKAEREENPELSNSAEMAVRRISNLIELGSRFGEANEYQLNTQEREERERSPDLSSHEETDAPRIKKGFSVLSRLFPYFGKSTRKVSGLQQRSITSGNYMENQPQSRRSSSRPFRPRLRWG